MQIAQCQVSTCPRLPDSPMTRARPGAAAGLARATPSGSARPEVAPTVEHVQPGLESVVFVCTYSREELLFKLNRNCMLYILLF